MRAPLAAASPLLAAILWSIALMADPSPYDTASAVLIAVGLMIMTSVATVGMIVTGGRWARLLALGALAATGVAAIVRPIDPLWVIAVVASAVSLLALFSPGLTGTIRRLPSASGPPPRAVAAPLVALGAPTMLGLAGAAATDWTILIVGLTAPVAAFMYTRVIPGGLLVMRVLWPVLAIGLAPMLGLLCGTVAVLLALTVAVLSWHPEAKASYHPPQEAGSSYPIPPELAPNEVLDAAQIDEKGRRQ